MVIPAFSARSRSRLLTLGALVLAPVGALSSQQYPSPPEILKTTTERGVAALSDALAQGDDAEKAAEEFDAVWDRLVAYTVADALQIRTRTTYSYLIESARTEKQVGSTSSAPGSTTLSQKAGIPELLALAIEHGAIEQSVNGTGVTLSTSPYAFVRLIEPDNAENFERFGSWRRIGVSATFNPQTESPGSANIKQLNEWSLRLRVLGDRSTRTSRFTAAWNTHIRPIVQERANAQTALVSKTVESSEALKQAAERARTGSRAAIAARLREGSDTSKARLVADLSPVILDSLYAAVYRPIADREITISDMTREDVSRSFARLAEAQQQVIGAQAELDRLLDDLESSMLLTLEYTHHAKSADSSGFSDMRVLFEDKVAPFNVVANAFLSIYDNPDAAIGQRKVRDYGASLDVEGGVRNPFGRRGAHDLVEPITISVGYQLSQLKEADEMVHIAQAKLNIPISVGVSLPLSVTYASRGVVIDEEHVRGNFGFSLDLDKLYAISKAFAGN